MKPQRHVIDYVQRDNPAVTWFMLRSRLMDDEYMDTCYLYMHSIGNTHVECHVPHDSNELVSFIINGDIAVFNEVFGNLSQPKQLTAHSLTV